MTLQIHLELTGALENWAREQTDPAQAILQMLSAQISKEMTPFETAAEMLKDKVVTMPIGFEFNIQQVIGHDAWQALNRESRLGLGRYVRANQGAFGLVFVRKNSSNHAIYKRTESELDS
ncbi:single-stranded DNA-binding protein [Pseudomonas stutzeri]|jgi:hypothetical protein|uniref:DUF1413 domain-containing protein n=1 Tax=Stutzerimonas stutzeri TaxID=316 RepID=UPI001E5F072C|nr:DUF1413 domain-containing protein [Stutzerimonas stutzeri]MCC8345406.1 single-stranded DNA-binding protein [Stutzerimonas stutzeri]